MQTQNYHTQNGAIHNGYAHIASLSLIDLIAEANTRLDSRVPPEGAEEDSGGLQNHQCTVLASLVLLSRCLGTGSINAGSLIPGCPEEEALGLLRTHTERSEN